MYHGVAVYNTKNISSIIACELGEKFFSNMGIPITGAGYYKKLINGDHVDDHDIIDISFYDLKIKIKSNEASAFRIYSEQKGIKPWYASFGYMTDEFGGFYYIDAQYPNVTDESKATTELFNSLSHKVQHTYGIKYYSDKVTKVFHYATGDNMVNIYKYENSSLFKRECPGRFEGRERYKNIMLRMVYPVNMINRDHLDININNIKLKEWILSDNKYGILEELKNNQWLWTVKDNEIDEINKYLGEAGILISWKPLAIKKTSGQLP